MTLVDASLLITTVFFSIYGLLAAIECGIAIKVLIDRKTDASNLFTPLWEITNVFLVFGFTSLAMLFNGALSQLSHALLSTLSVALVALLARASIVLTIFYLRPKTFPPLLIWLLLALNFAIPLSFTAAGAYLLSGQPFWASALGWALVLTAATGLAANGLAVLNRHAANKPQMLSELLYVLWLLFLGSLLPLAFKYSSNVFQNWPVAALVLLSGLGLALVGGHLIFKVKNFFWPYGLVLSFTTPFLLAWANRPYLIAGKLTLEQAFGARTYASAVIAASLIMLPLIVVGARLFLQLWRSPEQA